MNKLYVSITTLFFAALSMLTGSPEAIGQERSGDWCSSDEYNKKMMENARNTEEIRKQVHNMRDRAMKWARNNPEKMAQVHKIPVVVHVLHDGGQGNISYAQIKDGIRVLNEDFRRLNEDTNETRDLFREYAADPQFEFALAQKDPQGNCTNGVVRVRTDLTYGADSRNDVKFSSEGGSDAWPTDQYFNFWLVNNIGGAGGGGQIAGFAQLPQQGVDETYGVVQLHSTFGEIGTSGDGRTATHEVGHATGLLHTFQSGYGGGDDCGGDCSSSGDRLCDTPPVLSATQTCDEDQNTCSNDTQGPSPYSKDVVDQIENYMSYDRCQNMFTKEQKAVMKNQFNNTSALVNLTSQSNLEATGVAENDILCEAEFRSEYRVVCQGQTIQFRDASYNGVSSWDWTFEGGNPSSSKDQHPEVTYDTPGVYDVSLTAGNGNNTVSETKADYVVVLEDPGASFPYYEGFESSSTLPSDHMVQNPDDSVKWEVTGEVSKGGGRSIMLDNFNNVSGATDAFVSKTIDLSDQESVTLSFDYAYANKTSGNEEELKIYASSNCGLGWSSRRTLSGDFLETADPTDSEFVPSGDADWKHVEVNTLVSTYFVSDFRYKFEFTGKGGNNIYIDNINLSWPTAVEEEEAEESRLDVRPNPVDQEGKIAVDLRSDKNVSIQLYNMLGKSVRHIADRQMTRGDHKLDFNVEGLSSGVYFIKAEIGDEGTFTQRIMVK